MIPYAATPGTGNLRRLPIALALIFALTLTASAQQAAPADAWAKVQALPAGTSIRVNTAKAHTRCTLKSETSDTLTCVQGKLDVTFPRADIQTIKVGRRGRSAAIGAIPGGIVMAGAGVALAAENCTGQLLCGLGHPHLEISMKKPAIAILVMFSMIVSATSQQVSPEVASKNWKKLQTIPTGRSIHVKTAQTTVTCALQFHTQDTLTCTQKGHDLVFQRTQVDSIKVAHGTWGWVTNPWFVVPAVSGGTAAVAAEVPHGDVLAQAVLLVLMGLVFLVRLAGG